MPLRKPTKKSSKTASRINKARLAAMIEEATIDAYGDSEQTTGWYTMIEEHVALPFETTMLGVVVQVARVDLLRDNTIVAICTRGRERQSVPILDLPLPSPRPEGVEWIEAYRHWIGVFARAQIGTPRRAQPGIFGTLPWRQGAAVPTNAA